MNNSFQNRVGNQHQKELERLGEIRSYSYNIDKPQHIHNITAVTQDEEDDIFSVVEDSSVQLDDLVNQNITVMSSTRVPSKHQEKRAEQMRRGFAKLYQDHHVWSVPPEHARAAKEEAKRKIALHRQCNNDESVVAAASLKEDYAHLPDAIPQLHPPPFQEHRKTEPAALTEHYLGPALVQQPKKVPEEKQRGRSPGLASRVLSPLRRLTPGRSKSPGAAAIKAAVQRGSAVIDATHVAARSLIARVTKSSKPAPKRKVLGKRREPIT